MKGIKTKQHYLPKFYLEGFSDKHGKVWMYKKADPNAPSPVSPSKTACENALYHIEPNEINNINTVEDFFSNEIESKVANAFKELRDMKWPNTVGRKHLSLFFGTLMVRTPGYLKHLQGQFDKEFQLISQVNGIDEDKFNEKLKNVSKRNELLSFMLDLGKSIGEYLHNMPWALIRTDERYPFITSDMIINIFNPNIQKISYFSPGLGSYESTLFIPISTYLSLMMVNREDFIDGQILSLKEARYTISGEKIDLKKLIKNLNKTVYIKAYRFIFAGSNSEKLKRMFGNILSEAKPLIDSPIRKKTGNCN